MAARLSGLGFRRRPRAGSVFMHDRGIAYQNFVPVLFGGQIGARPETWEWDGSKWLQVAHIGPEARNLLAMAFNGRSILLFGGRAQLGGAVLTTDDTWEWDGKFWVERRDFCPPPRLGHAMSFDTGRTRAVLFGGSVISAEDL